MSNISAPRDNNRVPVLMGTSSVDGVTPVTVYVDPTTHRLLTDISGSGSGTVTSVSVVSANGFAGTVATATTTPAITISTTINSAVLAGNGTAIAAATVTGTGSTVVLNNGPTLIAPVLGTPASGVATNLTGTASGLTAGNVTTNANLTGVITSVGNATSIASQTGTGTKFVVDTSPTLVTPVLGVASATSINKITLTTPATGSTLTLIDGKTLTINKTMSFTAADDTGVYTLPTGTKTLLATDGAGTSLTGIPYTLTGTANQVVLSAGTGNITFSLPQSIGTASNPQFATIELGAASDTTIARSGAGAITVEGVQVILSGAALGTPASGTLTNCTGLPIAGLTASTSTAIGVGSIELGAASDTTIARVSAGVISVEGVTVPTISSTSTITNKRNQPRIVSTTSYTTDTGTSLDVSTTDLFVITAQAGALKFNNPSGTPVQGEKLLIRIKDNGTARALTYDTQFRASSDLALPTTTVLSKTLYMGFIYNSTDTKWDLLAVLNNF